MNTVLKGKKGESYAADFLKAAGYTIVKRNFRHRGGEIDIIAEKEDQLVFVEVKTWDAFYVNDTEYAVNKNKIKKIINTAKLFLTKNNMYTDRCLRFDLIFITGNCSEIKHIENAFSEV